MSLSLAELFVYLVEPSHVQAKLIRGYLEALGIFRIEVYHDGTTALTKMHDTPPDLVISALYLPDMLGTDLVYAMRDDPYLEEITYMLVSSETNPRRLEPIRQSGAIAILPKPFSVEQLKRALINTLDFLNPETLALHPSGVDIERLHVLVVDDSVTSRHQVKRILNALGITDIVEAGNGVEAVRAIDRQFFDMIVTDYNMPEMDGEALVRYIRERSSQSSVPILMVSSEQDRRRLANVQQAGVSAICDKPFEAQGIRELVEKLLR